MQGQDSNSGQVPINNSLKEKETNALDALTRHFSSGASGSLTTASNLKSHSGAGTGALKCGDVGCKAGCLLSNECDEGKTKFGSLQGS